MLGVPMIVREEVIGILFLDNEDAVHPFDSEQQSLAASFAHLAAIAIMHGQRSSELRANLVTIARQNEVLRQSSAIEERLTRLALEGATFADIANAVSDLTGKPCAIHDAEYRRLAAGSPASGDAPIATVLDDAPRRIPAVAEALAALKPDRQVTIGPLPAGGMLHRFLVTSIVAGGKEWGYLAVTEFGGRLTALDIAASRHCATAIAFELALERRAAVADSHERQALTRDLVNGLEDEACLVRRAEVMGFRIASPHVVCLLSAEGGGGPLCMDEAEATWAGIGQTEPIWATTVPLGGLALIVELDEDVPRAAELAHIKSAVERFRLRLDPGRHVLAAVSSPCRVPADYSRGCDEATQVLRCLASLRGGENAALSLLAAEDLGASRLLLNMVDGGDAAHFTRNALGPLLDGDNRLAAQLLHTVRVFFDSRRSVRTSAKRLGLHENTIRYRLSRVLDLTGLDVTSDADAQLTVQVALSVLHIQGRLPTLSREGDGS
jgi:sugar diacid utilization regulator